MNSIVEIKIDLFLKYKKDIYNCILSLKKGDINLSKKILNNMYKYISDKSAIIYGYLLDNKIVAIIWTFFIDDKNIHINYFVVLDEYRNNRIGKKMLEYVIKNFKENTFELFVSKENIKAIKFYKKNGFEIVEEKENKYKMFLGCVNE